MINRIKQPRALFSWLRQQSAAPFFCAAAAALACFFLAPSGDWRLMAAAWAAAFFNFAVLLLSFRLWPTGIAASGLLVNSLVQSLGMAVLCISGVLHYLDEFELYTVLYGREERVLLVLIVVSLAQLVVLALRRTRQKPTFEQAMLAEQRTAQDPRLPLLLIGAAVFGLMAWVGGALSFGIARSVFQILQRMSFFVPFLAGYHFRVSRPATLMWGAVLVLNLGIGIATGGRGNAFMPLVLYSAGMLTAATGRQRLLLLSLCLVLAYPAAYVFGMIEVIRTDVGRLTLSELSFSTISNVASRLGDKNGAARDSYEQIPASIRTNIRVVTWPNLVVAAVAGNGRAYRGFSDVPDQIWASLNMVSLSGEMNEYYNEGLFNLRASDYGFRVDTGTSVEFGLLPESWDRGGPIGSFVYILVTIAGLGWVEASVRKRLRQSPALCAIIVSVVFTTSFWTLNIYNLPLSAKMLGVNLIVGVVLFGSANLIAGNIVGKGAVDHPTGGRETAGRRFRAHR